MDEIELKFIEIDKEEIIKKILALGAVKKYKKELQNACFDGFGFARNDSSKKYLRIRKEGDESYLTYKSPAKDSHLHIREEYEVEVSDFDETLKIVEAIGFETFRSKKTRTHFELGSIHFEIDEWGFVPAFLEIETKTEQEMHDICEKLGLKVSDGHAKMITEIYPDKFE